MANILADTFLRTALEGNIDLENDTIKVMLLTNSHTPAKSQEFVSEVNSNEATIPSAGYSAGGWTLSSVAVTVESGNIIKVDAADLSNAITGTLTARHAVFYKDTGVAATSPIICQDDFGSDQTATDGDFDIALNASGLLQIDNS